MARLASLALLLASVVSAVPNQGPPPCTVKHGQSIQAAIDRSPPGSTITVEAGTYKEQLLIKKNGITLIGQNAILVPPPTPMTNDCTGLTGTDPTNNLVRQAGICVYGANVKLDPYVTEHRNVTSVGTYVKDVTITGFEVKGFSGLDIAIVGAQNAKANKNRLTNGNQYGLLTAGSKNTEVSNNVVVSTEFAYVGYVRGFIGICMDDQSDVKVTYNDISGHAIGLCVETNGAEVHHNTVHNVCIGAYVDPAVSGAKITDNTITSTNPLCVANFGSFIFGVVIDGAFNTVVKDNTIEGITDFGTPNNNAAGVGVFDEPGDAASGNTITENKLSKNDQDFLNLSTGANNKIANNQCGKKCTGL